MLDPMKNKKIGIDQVIEKFGLPPEKVIQIQALTGDKVDNIPGAPGIGPKTALQSCFRTYTWSSWDIINLISC